MELGNQNGKKATVPVYLSFKTFQSAIQSLRNHGLPNSLDRTAFGSRSGAEQTQILSAFRFLGLSDENDKTQEPLRALVKSQENSTEEKQQIATLLKERYANAFALNLEGATPAQLEKTIGDYGTTGATRDRAVRFFIKAAEHCGIKLSTRLTARKPRSPSAGNGDDQQTQIPRKRSKSANTPPAPPAAGGSQIKTISLPDVGGTLTISGTFNFFDLVGDERELVLGIIDQLSAFQKKQKPGNE
jgi:hypothetical protein